MGGMKRACTNKAAVQRAVALFVRRFFNVGLNT